MMHTSRRTLEISTAIVIALAGAIVSAGSLTHDIGWNETGPGAGYFPFRIGLLLIAAAAAQILQAQRTTASSVFVTGPELQRTLGVFVPTVVLVAGMFAFGCYAPSALFLAWMMRRHGGYGWMPSIACGVAVMAAFFVVFEIWFRVPLAKGPLEAALGIY